MIWIIVIGISAIVGVFLWACYMIGFRSTGRHADNVLIEDDAMQNVIQSMQLIPEAPKMTYYDLDIVSAYPGTNTFAYEGNDFYPLTEYARESTMDDLIIEFYELQESITEIGIPAGW